MAEDQPPPLPAPEIAQVALRDITKLTGRQPLGATSVMPSDDGWTVEVEVVEDRRIPSSADILALYEVVLDLDGQLLSYRRTRRYMRGSTNSGAQPHDRHGGGSGPMSQGGGLGGGHQSTNLGDILERVLDKGLVIAGDIQVNLLDIELLTIKVRLVIASLETAKEVGIDWWEHDPWLTGSKSSIEIENARLRERIAELRVRPLRVARIGRCRADRGGGAASGHRP